MRTTATLLLAAATTLAVAREAALENGNHRFADDVANEDRASLMDAVKKTYQNAKAAVMGREEPSYDDYVKEALAQHPAAAHWGRSANPDTEDVEASARAAGWDESQSQDVEIRDGGHYPTDKLYGDNNNVIFDPAEHWEAYLHPKGWSDISVEEGLRRWKEADEKHGRRSPMDIEEADHLREWNQAAASRHRPDHHKIVQARDINVDRAHREHATNEDQWYYDNGDGGDEGEFDPTYRAEEEIIGHRIVSRFNTREAKKAKKPKAPKGKKGGWGVFPW